MVTRSALIYLSRQEGLKEFATRFRPFKKLTTRFVAGETIDEAVAAIKELNAEGCSASFDHLNESVANSAEAEAEIKEYLQILNRIDETGIDSNVSIKLTQFGLELDPELAYRNSRAVVEDAARRENFVRVDMEGSNVTQLTIDFAQRQGISKGTFEFQMLYGVRRDLQRQLAKDGYNLRIYVPYGKHWYPYFMRRLAERPANIWFVLKNLLKG